MDKGISNYFTKGPVAAQPKAKVYYRKKNGMAITNMLDSLSKQKQMMISLLIFSATSILTFLDQFPNLRERIENQINGEHAHFLLQLIMHQRERSYLAIGLHQHLPLIKIMVTMISPLAWMTTTC